MYDYNKVMDYLNTKHIGQTFVQYEEIKSVSDKAKHISTNCPEGMVVLTENQTNGKVELSKPSKTQKYRSILLGIILKSNQDCLLKFTNIIVASVSKSFEELNIDNKIKYPDTIMINNNEVCHILCEKMIRKNEVNSIIVQICINIPILEKDTIEENSSDDIIEREKLIAYILNNFEQYYDEFKENNSINSALEICREKSIFINKYAEINKIGRKTIKRVKVLDITDNGEILTENKNKEKEIISLNEFSIRIEDI